MSVIYADKTGKRAIPAGSSVSNQTQRGKLQALFDMLTAGLEHSRRSHDCAWEALDARLVMIPVREGRSYKYANHLAAPGYG